jgi:hypothetical protein
LQWVADKGEKALIIVQRVSEVLANKPPEDTSQVQFTLLMLPLWQKIVSIGADAREAIEFIGCNIFQTS